MFRLRHLVILLLSLELAQSGFAASPISILFVGNSLTQANDLPSVFKNFTEQSRLRTAVEVHSITPGGAFFQDHWKRGQPLAMLRQLHPTIVVLQGQSLEPLLSPQNFRHYAGLLKNEADQINATTILFSTWARPPGDSYYEDQTSGGSPAEMQTRLNSAYGQLAASLNVSLAPVGRAWEVARTIAPDIQLLDGTQHPSPAGTYLAAAVLFRVVFNAPATGSTYFGGLSREVAIKLQQVADETPLTRNGAWMGGPW